jgi:hypothetical protein
MNFKDFKSTREKVQFLLNSIPQTRDNDSLLIAIYWKLELGADGDKPTKDFLRDFLAKDKMTPPESIRRFRQSLQEKNPTLRGKSYRKRQRLGKLFNVTEI